MAESRRLSGNHSVSVLTAYVMVGLGSLIMLAPFYFMFVFATHSKTEIFTLPPPLWPGTSFFENLKILTEKIHFWKSLGWSLYIALASTALTLIFCSMGGYAFAMFEIGRASCRERV